jgi:ABC-type sugar transport system substrate-binding protein
MRHFPSNAGFVCYILNSPMLRRNRSSQFDKPFSREVKTMFSLHKNVVKCTFLMRCHIAFSGFLLTLAAFGLPGLVLAQTVPIRPLILYYNSATPDNHWWRTSSEIMQAACDNLGLRLKVVYVDRDHLKMIDDFKAAANSPNRPDAVVFQSLKQNGPEMLKIAEQAKIPAFIFNAGLTAGQTAQYGGPRQHFKYWIGQMLPNDRAAGYDLALALLRQAQSLGLADTDGKVRFVAINGTPSDGASIERAAGLALAARQEPDIILQQTVSAHWQRDKGKAVFLGLAARYPKTMVVWAANDLMALGVLDGMQERRIEPGQHMLVGSIDWVPEALQAVDQKRMVATLGGHFMETAWVSVLLYDYFQNKDFAGETTRFKSEMSALSGAASTVYLEKFKPENFAKIDFRRFSKAWHPERKEYGFSFAAVMEQISPPVRK